MLQVNVTKKLGNFILNTSFNANKGVLGILGSSGCGKSMILKSIAGLQKPDSGKITLNGKTLFDSGNNIHLPARSRRIGYVFQNYALFPHLTVQQNIAYGLSPGLFSYSRVNQSLIDDKVQSMVERMHLVGLEHHYPSQLSGGQQQRTSLARTLVTDPELLLLDEPFSALDSHIKHQLEKELLDIIKANFDGIVLLVTHNIEEAYRLSDNIMVMDHGTNCQYDAKDTIIHHPINSTVARITGCKNILPVTLIHQNPTYDILQCHDLQFKAHHHKDFESKEIVAGIRAHHLQLATKKHPQENTYDATIIDKIEGVFSTTLLVNCQGCQLHLEIAKASYPHLPESNNAHVKIHIPSNSVMLLNN